MDRTRQTLEKLFEQEETRPDVIIFQLEIPLETVEECIRFVKERKEDVEIILNAAPAVENLDSVFSLEVDHLIVNETEISLLLGSPTLSISNTNDKNLSTSEFETWKSILLPWKFKKDIKFLIVTLGSKGVLFFASSPGVRIERYYPAMEVQDVVDTTAAGDTFVGVYGVGIAKAKKSDRDGKLKWEDVEGVVLKANRVAAVTITRRGAMGSIPWRDGVV